ncbi:unnamed protein product [Strongylus vulgaris]|uniref:Uncharacterized protein n=1 Tax=Strongylus vulgaris TaxID=40348 RepID=A0A3P7J6A3_STRVU|nr:unnamed protein product [Strongylus vulgaris]
MKEDTVMTGIAKSCQSRDDGPYAVMEIVAYCGDQMRTSADDEVHFVNMFPGGEMWAGVVPWPAPLVPPVLLYLTELE